MVTPVLTPTFLHVPSPSFCALQDTRRYRQFDQRGQALVFSLITVGIIILTMVMMYSMSQQVLNKVRLQNTADAAAYSAAVTEARDYNYSAYINRAVIANQVSVAQMVSLDSLAINYNNIYKGNFSEIPQVLADAASGEDPMVEIFWSVPWDINSSVSSVARTGLKSTLPFLTKGLGFLIEGLNLSQQVYHYGTIFSLSQVLGISPTLLANKLTTLINKIFDSSFSPPSWLDSITQYLYDDYDIVKLNDKDAALSDLGLISAFYHLYTWVDFTELKDPNTDKKDGEKADRMGKVTKASVDDFVNDRSLNGAKQGGFLPMVSGAYPTPAPALMVAAGIPLPNFYSFLPYPPRLDASLMYLWHRGGTELKNINNAKKTWSAMDATGFTAVAILWIEVLFVPIPIPIPMPLLPMGYGSAIAGPDTSLSASNNFDKNADDAYGGVYNDPQTAAAAAYMSGNLSVQDKLDSSSRTGLQKYFDMKEVEKDPADKNSEVPDNLEGPPLLLEVQKSADAVPSSNARFGGQFTLKNGSASNSMRAMSKAQVYFSRPSKLWKRDDGKTELGSLYSPYWQARLMPNNLAEQYIFTLYQLVQVF